MTNKEFVIKLKQKLQEEYIVDNKYKIYAYMQKMLAYHSNNLEGNLLTTEQVASIFYTGEIYTNINKPVYAVDVMNVVGHFNTFIYILRTLDEPLSEEMIRILHYNYYTMGDCDNRTYRHENLKDLDINTPSWKKITDKIEDLLQWYHREEQNVVKGVTLATLINLYIQYEKIHPFKNANSRTGRIILLRECLRHNIIPVIPRAETKEEYKQALHKALKDDNYDDFTNYALKMQEWFIKETLVAVEID